MLPLHRKFPRFRVFAALLALLACSAVLHAGDAPGDSPATTLTLAEDPLIPQGKGVLMKGVADATGDRYELPDTDLLQPIAVFVYTRGAPAGAVRLRVGKGDWSKPSRDGTTDASGRVVFRFRTYDGVKILVSADTPTPYQLFVWSDKALDFQPPPFSTPMSAYVVGHPDAPKTASAASVSTSALSLVIGGVIALLLLIVGVRAFRHSKTSGAKS